MPLLVHVRSNRIPRNGLKCAAVQLAASDVTCGQAALRNGAHQRAPWAFGGCSPAAAAAAAAAGVHLCVCVHVSECAHGALRPLEQLFAAADLKANTPHHIHHLPSLICRIRKQGRAEGGRETTGAFHSGTPFMGTWAKNDLSGILR